MEYLAYIDDVVLMAKEANDIRKMLKSFSRFLEKKGINPQYGEIENDNVQKGKRRKEKSAMAMERNRNRRSHFKYLDYMLQRNNKVDEHIKETIKKVICRDKKYGRQDKEKSLEILEKKYGRLAT